MKVRGSIFLCLEPNLAYFLNDFPKKEKPLLTGWLLLLSSDEDYFSLTESLGFVNSRVKEGGLDKNVKGVYNMITKGIKMVTKRIRQRNENIIRDHKEHKMTYRALGRRYKLSHTQIMNIVKAGDDTDGR
jgi:hypothetical protein